MMRVDAGIIGGTGTGERLAGLGGEVVHVPTARGFQRGRLIQVGQKQVFAMSRHSAGHKVPPHLVNYAAMALSLQALGARACYATAAVGSLKTDLGCGSLVACSDFIDVSGRYPTLFDRTVTHTDFSNPFPGRAKLVAAANSVGTALQDGGVYVCGNGPRYETPEEIKVYAELGGDVVGMTAASEAILMREAGIDYGCLAIVTNLACGIGDSPLSHSDVITQMKTSGEIALDILLKAVELS